VDPLIKIRNVSGHRVSFVHGINNFLLRHAFKGVGKLRNMLAKLILPDVTGPRICPTIYDFKIIVEPNRDQAIEQSIYFHGTYEAGTVSVMQACLQQGDCYIDVGGNIGFLALVGSQLVGPAGHVHVFEPEPEIFSILRSNIHLNEMMNVTAYEMALGAKRDKGIIYANAESIRGGASFIKPAAPNLQGNEVFVESLDQIIVKKNIKNIKFVKIDVEGWELDVLQGGPDLLSRSDGPILSVEFNAGHRPRQGALMGVFNFIISINQYFVYKLVKGKDVPSKLIQIKGQNDLPVHDNLFCFLPGHLEELKSKGLI